MQDAELLTRWRDGDQRAGSELFERHFESLFRFFCSKADAAAEDLTQETLMVCVANADRIEHAGAFRAYMFGTARNVLLRHYGRKQQRATEDLGASSVAELAPGPSSIVVRREEERILLEALRRLPLDYQIAVELHHFEHLSGPEIASVLGIPEGTVRSRIRRARLQLEQKIRELTDSPVLLESTLTRLDDWTVEILAQLSPERSP